MQFSKNGQARSLEMRENDELLRVVYERRAIRKFKDLPLDRKLIEEIIDSGRMAPSAMNKQPWRFYVLTKRDDIRLVSNEVSKSVLKGIVKSGIKGVLKTASDFLHFSHNGDFLKMNDPVFHSAPAVILLASPKENEWADLDIGMCAQNIMLVAKYLGLDTCPVGMVKYSGSKLLSKLKIPKSERINLAIAIGYGDENPEPKERIKNNVTFI